jgi:septal ring-binding cell division protein DamX
VTETTTEKVTPIKTTQETKTVVEQPVVEKQEVKPVEKKPEEQKVVEVKPVETKPVVQEVKPVVEEKKSTGINTVSDMSGVFYTVQIGASKEKLNSDYYNKYSFDKEVNEMLIDGMYKYSLGKFPTLKEANSYMPSVKQKNIQCFVVAYMDGKRVSVSEALAVSKK